MESDLSGQSGSLQLLADFVLLVLLKSFLLFAWIPSLSDLPTYLSTFSLCFVGRKGSEAGNNLLPSHSTYLDPSIHNGFVKGWRKAEKDWETHANRCSMFFSSIYLPYHWTNYYYCLTVHQSFSDANEKRVKRDHLWYLSIPFFASLNITCPLPHNN